MRRWRSGVWKQTKKKILCARDYVDGKSQKWKQCFAQFNISALSDTTLLSIDSVKRLLLLKNLYSNSIQFIDCSLVNVLENVQTVRLGGGDIRPCKLFQIFRKPRVIFFLFFKMAMYKLYVFRRFCDNILMDLSHIFSDGPMYFQQWRHVLGFGRPVWVFVFQTLLSLASKRLNLLRDEWFVTLVILSLLQFHWFRINQTSACKDFIKDLA
jgi:hypothetical protein